nr:MAG TPA: hypothetical protein [Caudoviricetes sp.]
MYPRFSTYQSCYFHHVWLLTIKYYLWRYVISGVFSHFILVGIIV